MLFFASLQSICNISACTHVCSMIHSQTCLPSTTVALQSNRYTLATCYVLWLSHKASKQNNFLLFIFYFFGGFWGAHRRRSGWTWKSSYHRLWHEHLWCLVQTTVHPSVQYPCNCAARTAQEQFVWVEAMLNLSGHSGYGKTSSNPAQKVDGSQVVALSALPTCLWTLNMPPMHDC